MTIKRLAAAAFIGSALAAPQAEAQQLQSVGQILQLEGGTSSDFVIRNGNRRRVARQHALLYPGDCVIVRGDGARAVIFVAAGRRRVTVRSADGCQQIQGARSARRSSVSWFRNTLGYLFGRPDPPVSSTTAARVNVSGMIDPGAVRYEPSDGLRTPLMRPAFLSSEDQSFPRSARSVALWWEGAAGDVVVSGPVGVQLRTQILAPRVRATRTLLPPGATSVMVVGANGETGWRIRFADDASVPRAPFLGLGMSEISDGDRIAWMAWLLEEGPPGWRLYALSELDRLSDSHYPAQVIIAAVEGGRWPPPAASSAR